MTFSAYGALAGKNRWWRTSRASTHGPINRIMRDERGETNMTQQRNHWRRLKGECKWLLLWGENKKQVEYNRRNTVQQPTRYQSIPEKKENNDWSLLDEDTRQHRWSLIHHSVETNKKVDADGRTIVEEVSIFAPTKQKYKIKSSHIYKLGWRCPGERWGERETRSRTRSRFVISLSIPFSSSSRYFIPFESLLLSPADDRDFGWRLSTN